MSPPEPVREKRTRSYLLLIIGRTLLTSTDKSVEIITPCLLSWAGNTSTVKTRQSHDPGWSAVSGADVGERGEQLEQAVGGGHVLGREGHRVSGSGDAGDEGGQIGRVWLM
ncbi:hypothetical protein [Nonomuraea sp. KM90]|uniref:hypothetical protein n=1 Tax=Nonomuraea sp. KM90 TaxID=3457428 RepID=UPI003FCE947D